MKRDILSVTESLSRRSVQIFCRILSFYVNRNVVEVMAERANEYGQVSVVLCTAAPICYVEVFAEKFNFTEVFATASVFKDDWKENMGEEKLKSIEARYGKDFIIDVVLTDHHDDMPLLLKAKKRLLVNPSKSTLERVSGRIDFDLLG